jgi:anti-anti-sigma factor
MESQTGPTPDRNVVQARSSERTSTAVTVEGDQQMIASPALRAAAESSLDADGDRVHVRLSDALLANGLADVRWLLHDALLAGARHLVVDLSSVQQLSSPAVASFLSAHRTCRARGGAVVLRGPNRRTLDLLHRTGLWRVLELESADRDAA